MTTKHSARDYELSLYVSGSTARSLRSIASVRNLCEKLLAGRYKLEVIDIYQQPELAREAQIVAVPTLVKTNPSPKRVMVGDCSDAGRLMRGLRLRAAPVI